MVQERANRLVDDEEEDTLVAEAFDLFEEVVDQRRGEPGRGLVEENEAGWLTSAIPKFSMVCWPPLNSLAIWDCFSSRTG